MIGIPAECTGQSYQFKLVEYYFVGSVQCSKFLQENNIYLTKLIFSILSYHIKSTKNKSSSNVVFENNSFYFLCFLYDEVLMLRH